MSITIAGILEALGIEITRAIPCMASEDDPSSLCVQIYKANGGELLAIDIVERLILDQEAPSDFQLILRNGQSLILSFSENDGKKRPTKRQAFVVTVVSQCHTSSAIVPLHPSIY